MKGTVGRKKKKWEEEVRRKGVHMTERKGEEAGDTRKKGPHNNTRHTHRQSVRGRGEMEVEIRGNVKTASGMCSPLNHVGI